LAEHFRTIVLVAGKSREHEVFSLTRRQDRHKCGLYWNVAHASVRLGESNASHLDLQRSADVQDAAVTVDILEA
jgi:hypothetical protein